MADIGTAYVQIVPAATGISNKISAAIGPGATQAGNMAGKKVGAAMGSKLQAIGGGLMKAGAIATAVSVPIIMGINKAMDAYQIQNAAETKLTEIYKTRMGVGKKAAKATMEIASAIQKEGVVGDEVTLSGAQQLATFAKYPGTVNKLLPAMDNLLVQQKGLNGTTQDATQIANLMGKVMQGQTGALKRVGVSFTESQEKVLKYGTEEERAAMLAQVITDNVGHMNKKMAETPEGKIQQMKNAFGDLAEQIGATLAPVLADVAKWVSENLMPKVEAFINFLKDNPVIAKIVVGIAGLLAVGGPLLIIIGMIVSSIGAILPVLGAISAPVLAIVAAIGAVIAALVYAWNTSEGFRTAVMDLVNQIWGAIQPLIPLIMNAIKTIVGTIGKLIQSIAKSLTPVIKMLTPILVGIINVIVRIAKTVIPILVGAFKVAATIISTAVDMICSVILAMKPLIIKVWGAIKTVAIAIWNGIKFAIVTPIKFAWNAIKAVIKGIKSAFDIFKQVAKTVAGVFKSIYKAITNPIKTAKSVIKGIIDKIKGFFSFKIKFPKIPLPHFSVQPSGWEIGDLLKGTIPSLGIDWYARGGIFTNPAIAGIGEAGPEAAVPLSGRSKMRPFAHAIAEEMNGAGPTYNIGDVTLDASSLEDVLTIESFVEVVKRAKGLGARR